jgi:hypothetical protein
MAARRTSGFMCHVGGQSSKDAEVGEISAEIGVFEVVIEKRWLR